MPVAEATIWGITKPIWFSYLSYQMSGIGLLYPLQSMSMLCSFLHHWDGCFIAPIKHTPSSALESISERCWQHLCFEHQPLPFINPADFPCMSNMTFCKHQCSCGGSEPNFSFSLLLIGFVTFWRNISFIKVVLMTSKTDTTIFLSLLIGGKGVIYAF